MSRSIRDKIKRALAQSVKHLEEAFADLQSVEALFEEEGRDEAPFLAATLEGMVMNRDLIITFARETYALDKEQLEHYL